ncbi:uncharacterized protein LOC108339156 [Vigna angularis]|uniref:uncharacterized protein LOC108339156 n=1 Tax=Phaseolus angularis TaxID=3914 RepID=UPI00080A6601|nr:uncharacterized protein LOC108339156 [Vigna angularis]
MAKKAHYATCEKATKPEEELLLVAYEEVTQSAHMEYWFLDSGYSNHMARNKLWFTKVKEEDFSRTVKLGNNTTMIIAAEESIRVHIDGTFHTILDVYYLPELKTNLLSLGQLQEKGLAILIQNDTCKIFHPERGLILNTDTKGNKMFHLSASMPPQHFRYLQAEDKSEKEMHLWHKFFGHLHFHGLSTLANKQMMIGLPPIKPPRTIFTAYLIGKQHRDPIPKQISWRASTKLQLICADIYGHISPASHSNKRYTRSFIDDYLRKACIYFLHENYETFANFKSLKVYVEREARVYITCLRTNRCGEFTSKEFT